jgi:hypothetical protein
VSGSGAVDLTNGAGASRRGASRPASHGSLGREIGTEIETAIGIDRLDSWTSKYPSSFRDANPPSR